MNTRVRRSASQIAEDLKARAQVAHTKAKKIDRAKHTRRAIIAGESILAMANAGDVDAKRAWDKMLAGLKRKQDREAFGLSPLPEPGPDNQPAANSSEPDLDTRVLAARVSRAVDAWNAKGINRADVKPLELELVDAVVALEKVTGECFSGIKDRPAFGLSDRPGELA